jgi:hypothetical protein
VVAVWSHEAWSPLGKGGQAWGVVTPLSWEDGEGWSPAVSDGLDS